MKQQTNRRRKWNYPLTQGGAELPQGGLLPPKQQQRGEIYWTPIDDVGILELIMLQEEKRENIKKIPDRVVPHSDELELSEESSKNLPPP
jgi:hypothetical protein